MITDLHRDIRPPRLDRFDRMTTACSAVLVCHLLTKIWICVQLAKVGRWEVTVKC